MKTLVIAIGRPKFRLGEIVITAAAEAQLDPAEVEHGICRHVSGDWGDVCPEDARANEDALKDGDRLMSVYGVGGKTFCIITEWDRSITTVLMPDDY
jgi:hypothetical protein